VKNKDTKTGKFIGKSKTANSCLFCRSSFYSYLSDNRKFCNIDCYHSSLLVDKGDTLYVSAATRQKRFREKNKSKFYDVCSCGAEKAIRSSHCSKCACTLKRQENNPTWKGGYEHKLKLNRERVLKVKVLGSHSPQEWNDLKVMYNFMCLCCKKQEPDVTLTRDHIIPISKGGSNDISNLQPLCKSCNSRKYNKIINYLDTLEITTQKL